MIACSLPSRRSHSLRLLVLAASTAAVFVSVLLPTHQFGDGSTVIATAFQPPRQQQRGRGNSARPLAFHRSFPNARPSTTTPGLGMLPPLPSSYEYDDRVVFFQRATQTRIVGKEPLEQSIRRWEKDFQTEVEGDDTTTTTEGRRSFRLQTSRATTTSPTTLLVAWNLTYVDPSVRWLVSLAETVPGWEPDFRTYTDQANRVRKFSYSALARLFADALATGKLRVPLACIEGRATCEFSDDDDEETEGVPKGTKPRRIVSSVTEDLAYAQDLNRGALSNRLCARDLQFFLEVARKPPEYRSGQRKPADASATSSAAATKARQDYEYWEDCVADSLPWRSVPGMMDAMYIEDQSEEDLAASVPLVFGALSVLLLLAFANWIAPNLIGQSLFGAPSYIVPPSELNDIIGY